MVDFIKGNNMVAREKSKSKKSKKMCGKSLTVPEKKTNFSVGAWRTDKMTHNTDTFSGLDS